MTHLSDDLLQEYVDSVLADSDNRTVEAHLSSCLICSKKQNELVTLENMVVESGVRQPSTGFNAKVMSRIAELNFSPAAKKEGSILFKIPFLFAAALAVLVIIFTVAINPDSDTDMIRNSEVQSISKSKEIADEYLSKVTELTEPIGKLFSFDFLKETGNSSLAVMVLIFAGSILIYQLFELFQDKWQRRKWITHMMV